MSTLAGTGAMVRLVLRRDRVRLPIWVLAIVGLLLSSVASVLSLYTTRSERASYASAVGDNAVAMMMGGPGAGLPAIGAIVVFEIAVVAYVAVGLMSVFLVVRHTRAEEEAGRTELLRAGVVGRHSSLVSALVVVTGAELVVTGAVAAGMVALGLPLAGTLALAASVLLFGLVMTALAAVAAQLSEHTRGASGLAASALAVFFVLRAAGDIGAGAVSWTSPMGWALAVRPFAEERWSVLLLPLVLGGVLVIAALALVDHRDIGAGLLPPRPGPASAALWLSSPLGLAVRQHRTALLGWGAGLLLLGLAYGAVADAVEELAADNPAMREFIAATGNDLVDAFFTVAASMLALIAAGFALPVATRMRGEEDAGRLEPLLATAVPRWQYAASHLLVAVVGSTALLVLAGLGMGLGATLVTGDLGQLGRLTAAALVYAPALWTLIGLAAALYGLVPRAVTVVWAVLAGCALIAFLGEPLQLPDWALDLSPYQHTPQVPADAFTSVPLLVLTAVAAGLVGAGMTGLRQRDVG